MIEHSGISPARLQSLIRSKQITMAGNRSLKIFGLLSCASGKRMKKENRVFFQSEPEAKKLGYRPCGNCMPKDYRKWKEMPLKNLTAETRRR
jgi:methylphosphotriester-DNA--protein-cysteine methyltransferase